jgi:hypothetical protein
MAVCGASLFGSGNNQYIKFGNGEFVAIEGSGIFDRLNFSDMRAPYKQLLKSRVVLKEGQTNYLLNHLGLGDNATFLAIKATYDQKSVNSDNNYVNYTYYNNPAISHAFAQMLVLTGNGTNRIPQLYLTNPNENYKVIIDVMIGIIDDNYSFFNDTVNQSATSFVNLEYTDIKSHIIGESIKVVDTSGSALIYLLLVNINSIEKTSTILTIDDNSLGTVFLSFKTEYDAFQALSLLNYVLENPSVDIDAISPISDDIDPTIYFYSTAGVTGSYIDFNGATSGVPYNTSDGFTFSTSISLSTWGTVSGSYSYFNKQHLIDLLVDYVDDIRDGSLQLQTSNIILTGTAGVIETINQIGTYSLSFDFSDIAHNTLEGVTMSLYIIS